MARDHYIPRCLTRPWHDPSIGTASLRFFDFETKKFGHKNSKRLFAHHGINSPATEAYLGKYIEDPFAIVQDRIAATDLDIDKVGAEIDKLPHTALAGLYWFLVPRIIHARERDTGSTESRIEEFASKGIAWLEEFTAAVFQRCDAIIYSVPNPMCFPSTGIFPIPLASQRPAMALPIHPMIALVFVDKEMFETVSEMGRTSALTSWHLEDP